MELYPAIDVQGGRVARSRTSDEPLAVARRYARDGARWIHFVDLDRAHGTSDNRELTRRFLAGAPLPVQLGGVGGRGLGTEAAIAELLGWGAGRVVIGSRTAMNADLVAQLLARHGPERLAIGIDARNGRVAPRDAGSPAMFAMSPVELARIVHSLGARTVIYTDAARDGMLGGADLEGARAIVDLGGLDVIVSGGIAALDDLRRAADAGLAGAIVGRALHEGRFTVAEALACVAV